MTMLSVGAGKLMPELVVFSATLLMIATDPSDTLAARVTVRLGERNSGPARLPVLMNSGARTSFLALIMNSPAETPVGNTVETGAETSCETKARNVKPLTGFVGGAELPHDTTSPSPHRAQNTATARLSNQAP